MFYSTETNDHGLRFNPIKAIVAPRPIGWISTMSAKGEVNLAPYSYFNLLAARPPIVMFSSEGWKDSVAFVAETGEFVCSLVSYDLRTQMNETSESFPRGVNEFEQVGLEMAASVLVKPPRIKLSPAALECKLVEVRQVRRADSSLMDAWQVVGEVVGVHIDDAYVEDGKFNILAARSVARCGYLDYISAEQTFSFPRPPGGGNPTGG